MHIPVLLKEVIEYLNPQANQNFIDCTFGGGGHATVIAKMILPSGKVLGIDCSEAIEAYKSKTKELNNLILVKDNFVNLKKIIEQNNFHPIDGIVIDLGLSSDLLENSGRGFSFLRDEPLDMRFDQNSELTAGKIVNYYTKDELFEIFKEYGEERFSRRIAEEIVKARKINSLKTTNDLIEVVKLAIPHRFQHSRRHFATRIFQALRIETNNELNVLKSVLPQAIASLAPKGRLAVISFHSLEDRIVKRFFKEKKDLPQHQEDMPAGIKMNEKKFQRSSPETMSANLWCGGLKIITKKPIAPSFEEIRENPYSRSAKLRVAERV